MSPKGEIVILAGGMYAGKTEELLRRLRRAVYARKSVQIFKPAIDNRYSESDVVSHDGVALPCTTVENPQEILQFLNPGTHLVGIDEAQFMDLGLVEVVKNLCGQGISVVCAGLQNDFQWTPFVTMTGLMGIADDVVILKAVCMKCGQPATKSYRVAHSQDRVLVGSTGLYEARCTTCFHDGTPES